MKNAFKGTKKCISFSNFIEVILLYKYRVPVSRSWGVKRKTVVKQHYKVKKNIEIGSISKSPNHHENFFSLSIHVESFKICSNFFRSFSVFSKFRILGDSLIVP